MLKLLKYLNKKIQSKYNENNIPSKYENPIKEDISKFIYNRVWTTKKIRMNSEERMNKKNLQSIILVNYYTFFILCYSIIGLKYNLSDLISIISVVVSIGLFGVSLFVSLYGYREKALAYKYSHIELDKIENNLEKLLLNEVITDNELVKEYFKLKINYTDIISKTENHAPVDFLKYSVVIKKATNWMWFRYLFLHNIPYYLFLITLYTIPLAGFFIIVKDIWG